jgi:phosphate uptake regulator
MKNMIHSEGIKFQDMVSTLMEMTHSMHEITFEALNKGNIEVAKFVLDRDKEVNPKNLAIVRMMNTYLQDLTLTQSLGVSLIEAQSYFATSLYLEMLADLAVSISRNVIDTIKLLRNENVVKEIVEIGEKITTTMKKIFKNWENKNDKQIRQPLDAKNVKKANSHLDNLSKLNISCKNLMKKYQEDPINSIFYSILEKMRRSIKILSNLCLVTIDLVEGKLPNS